MLLLHKALLDSLCLHVMLCRLSGGNQVWYQACDLICILKHPSSPNLGMSCALFGIAVNWYSCLWCAMSYLAWGGCCSFEFLMHHPLFVLSSVCLRISKDVSMMEWWMSYFHRMSWVFESHFRALVCLIVQFMLLFLVLCFVWLVLRVFDFVSQVMWAELWFWGLMDQIT